MRRILGLICFTGLSTIAIGQAIVPQGSFDKDSLKLGEETVYSLSISYPRNVDVIFPDSLYDFSPFELNRKQSFPTRSDSLFSFDSAVYHLTTFELDSIQILELPIFMVTSGDSTAIRPGKDTIILKHVVAQIPDSIAMKANTRYSNVGFAFNYPYVLVGSAGIVIVSIVLYLAFGKTLRKRVLLYRLRRRHRKFLEPFAEEIGHLKSDPDIQKVEGLLARWKKYLEGLERQPYTKLTSPEILRHYRDDDLGKSLQRIDGVIYGGLGDPAIGESFNYLRRISDVLFDKRVEEIQNG